MIGPPAARAGPPVGGSGPRLRFADAFTVCCWPLPSDVARTTLAKSGSGRTPLTGVLMLRPGQQRIAIAVAVKNVGVDPSRNRLRDARAQPLRIGHVAVAREQVAVGRRRRPDVARIGERRIDDVQLVLAEAVDLQRLQIGAGRQPVVEHAPAAAERRLAALERRPGESGSRREVQRVGHVRLRFVADAAGDRQVLPDLDVVLEVDAALDVGVAEAADRRCRRV